MSDDCLPEHRSHEKGYGRNNIICGRSKGGGRVVQTQKIESLIACYPAGTKNKVVTSSPIIYLRTGFVSK